MSEPCTTDGIEALLRQFRAMADAHHAAALAVAAAQVQAMKLQVEVARLTASAAVAQRDSARRWAKLWKLWAKTVSGQVHATLRHHKALAPLQLPKPEDEEN